MDRKEELGDIVTRYKRTQSSLKRLIIGLFPGTQVQYLVDYALIKSSDRCSEYKQYALQHYTYLHIIAALRQEYARIIDNDKAHEFAMQIFIRLAKEAHEFILEWDKQPEQISIEEIDAYIPPKPLEVIRTPISKNRRKRDKKLQLTEIELFAEAYSYNQEIAAKYDNSKDNTIVIFDELGIKSNDYTNIILYCIISLLYDASYIKWDLRKREIFAKGIIGLTAISTDLSYVEKCEPGSINKIMYSIILPFYETFKYVLCKHKIHLPYFDANDSTEDVELSVIKCIGKMAGKYDSMPNYIRKYQVQLYAVCKGIADSEILALNHRETGLRDAVNFKMIAGDYSFKSHMASAVFCGALLHGLTANSGSLVINDDDDDVNVIANLVPRTLTNEEFKDLNELLGDKLTKSTMFINCSKYLDQICKTCKCHSICDVKGRCLICDIFHLGVRKHVSMDDMCEDSKLKKHMFAVELDLYTPVTLGEYAKV